MHKISKKIRRQFSGVLLDKAAQSSPALQKKWNLQFLPAKIGISVFFLLIVLLISNQLQQALANQRFSVVPHQNTTGNTEQITAEIEQHNLDLPVRLVIPKIKVDVPIEYVGINEEGEMAVPSDIANVGWFALGPYPGLLGSAVIAGHSNGTNGEKGVFSDLSQLKKGDLFSIVNRKGENISFIVREKQFYNPGLAAEVFAQSTTAHLNLITCDGTWSNLRQTYDKRLVVFADKVNQSIQ